MILEFNNVKSIAKLTTAYASGCFDILHKGHIELFNDMKEAFPGHKIVIGVAPDERVQAKKGKRRPILDQNERITIIDSIKYVDYCFIYPCRNNGKTNPLNEIFTELKPNAFVTTKPENYQANTLTTDIKVHISKRGQNQSSSAIIGRCADC